MSTASSAVLREAAALMRERAQVVDTSADGDPVDGPVFTWTEQIRHIVVDPDATHLTTFGHPAVALAVADWLDRIAERHYDDGTEELVLHPDEPCAACEDGGHYAQVCGGCFPTWDAEPARAVWPCVEFNDALAVANAYLGRPTGDHDS